MICEGVGKFAIDRTEYSGIVILYITVDVALIFVDLRGFAKIIVAA